MRIQSRHSRRIVPTNRSANAFALRRLEGPSDDLDPFAPEDLVEGIGELVVAIVDQEPKRGTPVGIQPTSPASRSLALR